MTIKRGRPPRGGMSIDATKSAPSTERRGIDKYLDDDDYQRSRQSILHPHPDDFHVAISDENGNDDKWLGIRMHPSMANELEMLFHRETFPHATRHDIVRCSLLDYLRKCWEIEKRHEGVPNYIARLDAINRTSLKYEEMLRFDESRHRIYIVAEKLVAAGKKAAAAEYIATLVADIKQIPQKSWRDDLLKDVEGKWGYLVKQEGRSVTMKRKLR